MKYPYDLPSDIDITFEHVYPDGDNLYFSTQQLAKDLQRAHYDEEHISFIISALITYETKFKQDTIKALASLSKHWR